eukprot:11224775-Lingulodinium_polyedra.AAC.1
MPLHQAEDACPDDGPVRERRSWSLPEGLGQRPRHLQLPGLDKLAVVLVDVCKEALRRQEGA